MGLNVGQVGNTSSLLGASRESRGPGLGSTDVPRRQLGIQQGQDNGPGGALLASNSPAARRAGFGEGTVSGPGAALDALDRGLSSARRIVPSFEELRAQFQVRAAEARAEANRDVGARGSSVLGAEEENRGGFGIQRVGERDDAAAPETVRERGDEQGFGVTVESRIPEAAPEARRFTEELGEARAAESAEARDRDEAVSLERGRAETAERDERGRGPQNVEPRLDVFA